MPKAVARPWYTDAFRIIAILSGSGVLALAVTVGIYKQRIDQMREDMAVVKLIHDVDRRLAVIEERTKLLNSSTPAPVLRPTAGEQR